MAWERELATGGWTCVGWPDRARRAGAARSHLEVAFHEEYARAGGPGRAGLIGEGLLGPTLIHFATPEIQQRFLPGIVAGTEFWCQGYSEPNAGSDLANVSTRARLEGDEWVIDGQKVWTSLAQWSDWCFVVARTEDGLRAPPRPVLPAGADGPAGHRDPAHPPDHRHRRVQRGVLRRCPHRRADLVRRRARRRLEGGHGHARVRAGRAHPRPADGLRARARPRSSTRPAPTGRRDDPVHAPATRAPRGQRLRIMRWNALRALRVDEYGAAAPRGHDQQAVLGGPAPRHGRAGHGRARRRRRCSPATPQPTRATPASSRWVRPHKLFFFSRSDTIYGGSRRDPAQRDRRAGARACPASPAERDHARHHDRPTPEPTDRATTPTMHRPAPHRAARARACSRGARWSSPPPPAPASAGSLARRCMLEGARIVISDAHERRLGETADALAEEFGTRPADAACAT